MPSRLTVMVAAGLWLVLGLLPGRAAVAADAPEAGIQILGIDASQRPRLTAVMRATGALAGLALPPETITVRTGGSRAAQVEVERLGGQGLDVVIAVDTSGSMEGGAIEAARSAATSFLDDVPAGARIGVVAFGATATVVAPLSHDRSGARVGLAALQAGGETALYDALLLASSLFDRVESRRAVVVLSDGGDTVSEAKLEQVVDSVTTHGVRVDAVELISAESNRSALERISAPTGGGVLSVTGDALAGAYRSVAAGLASDYRLTWQTTAEGAVEVEVSVNAFGQAAHAVAAIDMPKEASPEPARRGGTITKPSRSAFAQTPTLLAGAAAMFAALFVGTATAATSESRRARLARLGAAWTRKRTTGSAVGEAARWAAARAEQSLERRGRRAGLEIALERSGIALRPGEFAVIVLAASGAAFFFFSLLGGPVLACIAALLVVGGSRLWLRGRIDSRRDRFAAQLGDALQLLASTLRAGYGILQALEAVVRDMEPPIRDELHRVVVEARLGRDMGDSLLAAAERVGSDDFLWVVQAIEIHREVGGDLAEVLDNVAATIRERNQLRGQIKSLSAEGRLSAWILLALPFVLTAALALMNPTYLAELTRGAGLVVAAIAVLLMSIGTVWLKRMCRLVF